MPATRRFVPSLSWARTAGLLFDHECHGQAIPHYGEAFIVLSFAGVLSFGGVALQRRAARWVSRRVRVSSSLVGALAASMTLLPVVVLGLASAVLAVYVDFGCTFRICLNGLDFGWGG